MSRVTPLCDMEIGGTLTVKKVRKYIEGILMDGEKIIATLKGAGDYLVVTNNQVVIMKKGIAS